MGGITNKGKVKWSKQALVQARGKLPRKLVVPGQRESGYRGCLPSITIVLACSTTDFFQSFERCDLPFSIGAWALSTSERKAIIHNVTVPLVIGLVSAWETGPEKAGAAVRNGSSTPQKRGADSNQRTRGKKGPRIDVSAYPDWRHLIILFFFLPSTFPLWGTLAFLLLFFFFPSLILFIFILFCIF